MYVSAPRSRMPARDCTTERAKCPHWRKRVKESGTQERPDLRSALGGQHYAGGSRRVGRKKRKMQGMRSGQSSPISLAVLSVNSSLRGELHCNLHSRRVVWGCSSQPSASLRASEATALRVSRRAAFSPAIRAFRLLRFALEQSELKHYRNAFYEGLEHFHFCLALARKAHTIRDKIYLVQKVQDARRRVLAVVEHFLAASTRTRPAARSKSSAAGAC